MSESAHDQFLRTLAHELRTPVSVALVWANLLREGRVSADQVPTALAAIEASLREQKRVVDTMSDAARISAGEVTLDRQRVDVAELLGESLGLIRASAEAKGLVVVEEIAPCGVASLDSDRFRQALSHLLVNAERHTPAGGSIRIAARPTDQAITIDVSDTGVGIDCDLLPHLFAPSMHEARRASALRHSNEHAPRAGLGLGLLIARRIVELHGGTLAAASEGIGRGATFTITLPRVLAGSDAEADRDVA